MKPKKQNFTVLLLYPDYLANDFGSDTYLAHVKAASVKKAIITARHDFISFNPSSITDENDLHVLLVTKGHIKDLK